jgi:DNA end-binding protein Ku
VPVNLHSVVRSSGVPLRMLAPDGTPLQRRYYCPEHEKDLTAEEVVRGYEVEPGEFVVVTEEDLESVAPRASRDIDLRRFVPEAEVDPILFENSYVLAPASDSVKAYALLAAVMEEDRRAGIATVVMREKEYLVAITAKAGVLHAATLRMADEVRDPQAVIGAPVRPDPHAVKAFEKAIHEAAADELDTADMRNVEAERLRELVERKQKKGEGVLEAAEAEPEEAEGDGAQIDVFQALQRSLAAAGKRGAAPRARRRSTARR